MAAIALSALPITWQLECLSALRTYLQKLAFMYLAVGTIGYLPTEFVMERLRVAAGTQSRRKVELNASGRSHLAQALYSDTRQLR